MPKENYGQKGLSQKPNTNAEGVVDEATDPINPNAIAPNNEEIKRANDAPENQEATERPTSSSKNQ